jgi:hypothetical protein
MILRIPIVPLAVVSMVLGAPACTPRAEKPTGSETGQKAPAAKEEPKAPPREREKPKRPLENARTSEWELCEAVLRALKAGDGKALQALRITETEYKQHLFPEFPATRAGTDTNADFHWDYLSIRSVRGVQNAINEFGGEDLELLDIIVEGVDKYPTYNLLRRVDLKVRRKPTGEERTIRVFGSIVELDGQYKILGFPN